MVAEGLLATRENAEDRVAQRSEHILGADQLGKLIEALVRRGYEVIGPTLRDGAIVYDQVESARRSARWMDRRTGAGALSSEAPRR